MDGLPLGLERGVRLGIGRGLLGAAVQVADELVEIGVMEVFGHFKESIRGRRGFRRGLPSRRGFDSTPQGRMICAFGDQPPKLSAYVAGTHLTYGEERYFLARVLARRMMCSS